MKDRHLERAAREMGIEYEELRSRFECGDLIAWRAREQAKHLNFVTDYGCSVEQMLKSRKL